jgi:hypothetical protein
MFVSTRFKIWFLYSTMNVNEMYVGNLPLNIYFVYCYLLFLSAKIAAVSVI